MFFSVDVSKRREREGLHASTELTHMVGVLRVEWSEQIRAVR